MARRENRIRRHGDVFPPDCSERADWYRTMPAQGTVEPTGPNRHPQARSGTARAEVVVMRVDRPGGSLLLGWRHRDDVGLDALDALVGEREDVTEGELEDDSARLSAGSGPDSNDHIALFDHAVHIKRRRPVEVLLLDLAIEGLLAHQMLEAGEVPHNVLR